MPVVSRKIFVSKQRYHGIISWSKARYNYVSKGNIDGTINVPRL